MSVAASSGMSIWSVSNTTSPVSGSTTGTAGYLPWMLTANDWTSCPFSMTAEAQTPSCVPQSSSRIMTSCETSTRRRVR